MESWYELAVANRILDDDKGRKKDRKQNNATDREVEERFGDNPQKVATLK